MIRILFLGDVVGEPGRKAVIARLPSLKEEEEIDFIIVRISFCLMPGAGGAI